MSVSNLSELTERFVCAPPTSRPAAISALLAGLKQGVQAGHADEVASALRRAALPTLDFTSAQWLCRIHLRLRTLSPRSQQKLRLAVLGSFTTKQLVSLIELQVFALG